MYHSPTSLRPALPPSAYSDPTWAEKEARNVLRPAWHPVATTDQLAATGDFITTTLLGVPVVVRRFGQTENDVVAMRNVCAHRQCLIVSKSAGNAEKLRCGYHGWEYGADGLTRRIPQAKNFPHFDREAHRLDRFAVERCGGLWFVRLASDGPSLEDWLGNHAAWVAERTVRPRWMKTLQTTLPAEANWKIPIEGSLESYHLAAVHAATFGADADPGEEHSEHTLWPGGTSFETTHRIPSLMTRAEDSALRLLGVATPDGRYEHHHLFPNLMLAGLHSMTLVTSVQPTGPQSSELRMWQWGPQPTGASLLDRTIGRLVARSMGRVAAKSSVAVLQEDLAMFPQMQHGLNAPGATGLLGRCEERLHAFQTFVADAVPTRPTDEPAAKRAVE